MHPILRIQHYFADAGQIFIIQSFEERNVEVNELGMLSSCGSELDMVSDKDRSLAPFDKWCQCHSFGLLGGFVD
jgi:hypothetical protein